MDETRSQEAEKERASHRAGPLVPVGLISPMPPQVGGVASVAEWLLAHAPRLGCRYEVFDLERPVSDEAGGVLRVASVRRQLRLFARFVRWLARSPRLLHYMVSLTKTGLLRDTLFIYAAAAFGRSVVAHVHGADVPVIGRASVRGRLLRAISRRSTVVVTLAPSLADGLRRLGIDAKVVWNPVRTTGGVARSRDDSGAVQFLFVGTYGARKGCPELVRALARARSAGARCTLRFVGKQEHKGEEDALRSLVRDLGLEAVVFFDGLLGADALAASYANADAFVLPSKREGLPMALLEAMAAGLPVITTHAGGMGDLVDDGVTGVVVEPGDVVGLAGALRALASDASLRRCIGAAGRERVLALAGDSRVVERWRAIYGSYSIPASRSLLDTHSDSPDNVNRGMAGRQAQHSGTRPSTEHRDCC